MKKNRLAAGFAALAAAASITPAKAHYRPHPTGIHLQALAQQVATPSLTTWSHVYKKGTKSYRWVMVGTDPAKGSAVTTVPSFIIPIIFTFPKGVVLDPTKSAQLYSQTPVAVTVASPIFQNFPFKIGTIDLGATQYVDAFQRANFWPQVSTTATNYHVLLGQPKIMPPLTIKITSTTAVSTGPKGVKTASVNSGPVDRAMINYIRSHPEITPQSFPIFLTYNVTTFDTSGEACGYHSNYGKQTYTITMFDDNGVCGTIDGDVDTTSHEVAEWMDDPFGNNVTPDKGHILEVGDNAGDYSFYFPTANFTYTLQDLLFHDYFTCTSPSGSANGWYDYLNKFKKPNC